MCVQRQERRRARRGSNWATAPFSSQIIRRRRCPHRATNARVGVHRGVDLPQFAGDRGGPPAAGCCVSSGSRRRLHPVAGNAVWMASPNPASPSQQAIRMSRTSRLHKSEVTAAQNRALAGSRTLQRGLGQPDAQHTLLPGRRPLRWPCVRAWRCHHLVVPHFDHDRVQEHHGVKRRLRDGFCQALTQCHLA